MKIARHLSPDKQKFNIEAIRNFTSSGPDYLKEYWMKLRPTLRD